MSNSNIHGVGDEDTENNGGRDYFSQDNENTPIFTRGLYKGDPRKQPLCNYLKEVICPLFTFKSFSFIILIINLVVFIASLIPNGLESTLKSVRFLPPSTKTLEQFGSLQGLKLRESVLQSYRWIANSILHANFEHIFSNSLGILFFGTLVEALIGTPKYTTIYILSGILGSLFSVLIDNRSFSVGASISCFGIMGCLLAFYVLNWNSLSTIFGVQNKYLIIMFPLMMIFLSFFIVLQGSSNNLEGGNEINIYGHLGGLIFGFMLSFIFLKPKENSDTCCLTPKVLFVFGLSISVLFAAAGFTCFYLLDRYSK